MRYRATFSIQFYCRKAKQNKNGEAPIEMGINFQGTRFFINLPRKANPKRFPKGDEDYLNIIERRIRTYEQECLDDGESVTVEGIKDFIRNGYSRPGKSVEAMWDAFFSSCRHKVSVGKLTAGVCRKYELVWEKFVTFTGIDAKQKATSINQGMVRAFCEWLDDHYENSSSCGMQQKLKSILLFGKENGFISTVPFRDKIVKVEKTIEIPSDAEFNRIVTTPLYNQSLEKVRDLWVFAAGSGLAYCDCASLSPDDFGEEGGSYFIKKRRKKTGVEFFSVLLPWAVDIAKKYNFNLPVISNQKTNCYLKTIGDLCCVSIPLHFHLARHYYACSLINNYRMPTDVIAKTLGHSKPGKITAHYAKMFDNTVLEEFKKSVR